MKKLPLWKLKREAKRAVRQLAGLPGVIWEYLFLRPLYDRKTSRQKVVHVNGGPKPGHWGGAKVGQLSACALERAALM